MFQEVFFEGLYHLGEHREKGVFGVEVPNAPPFKSDDTHALGALMMTREQVQWLWVLIQEAESNGVFNRKGIAMNHHFMKPLEDLQKMFDGVNFEKR